MNIQIFRVKNLLVLFLSILPYMLWGGDRTPEFYRILNLNTPTIRIGNNILKENDIFKDNEIIHWSDLRQNMDIEKVSNPSVKLSLNKHGFIKYKEQGVTSLFDFIKIKKLGTRDFNKDQPHYSQIDHYLTDTLMFPTTSPNDSSLRTEAFWFKGGKEIVTQINRTTDGKFYIVTPDIYKGKKPRDLKLNIREIDENLKWENVVYRNIPIIFIPSRL